MTGVGVDADVVALSKARQALSRLGIPGVRLVQADANELSAALAGGADFDLAYCRLMLMHQSDPAGRWRP